MLDAEGTAGTVLAPAALAPIAVLCCSISRSIGWPRGGTSDETGCPALDSDGTGDPIRGSELTPEGATGRLMASWMPEGQKAAWMSASG